MAFELQFGLTEIPDGANVFERTAVRAVIFYDGKVLMVKNNKGDYKFPGGGIEKGENQIDALLREIQEETGYNHVKIGDFLGTAIQQRLDDKVPNGYFRMTSFYYSCELVTKTNVGKDLDEYEEKQEFLEEFISLEEALAVNKDVLRSKKDEMNEWVIRETKVLETLLTLQLI